MLALIKPQNLNKSLIKNVKKGYTTTFIVSLSLFLLLLFVAIGFFVIILFFVVIAIIVAIIVTVAVVVGYFKVHKSAEYEYKYFC